MPRLKRPGRNGELPDYTRWVNPFVQHLDVTFLLLVLMLAAIGLVMMLSISYPAAIAKYGRPNFYFNRHFYFVAGGVGLMYLVSLIDYHVLRYLAKLFLVVAVFFLGMVLFKGFLDEGENARRWVDLGLFSFQPSELAKAALVIDFSASLAVKEKSLNTLKGLWPYLAKLVGAVILLMLEPHLSGTIIILCAGAAVLYVGGLDRKLVILGICGAVLGIILFLKGVIPYGQDRLAVWREPFADATGAGYQVVQGLLAIGSGGLTGMGLGNSRQKQLYLPEVQNDYIFSIVCEELGLIGACLILALFAVLIVRGYLIAMKAKDRFGNLLVNGFMTLFALQVFLNVGVVTGLLPNTGISLPFFSYGGTALIIEFLELGVVLSVSRQCVYRAEAKHTPRKKKSGRKTGEMRPKPAEKTESP